jgi:flagellar protein FlbD
MIELTKIDGEKILVSADEIETAESAFDTTVTLKSGRKIIVKENKTLIAELVILYKRECNKGLFRDEQ